MYSNVVVSYVTYEVINRERLVFMYNVYGVSRIFVRINVAAMYTSLLHVILSG